MQNVPLSEFITLLISACDRVIDAKEQVNSINVFPVPDQDTGSNMAATLIALKNELSATSDLSSAVSKAFSASQGNSGMIMTSFLRGFLDNIGDEVTLASLAENAEKGLEYARESIGHPKSGTILDVIESFAANLEKEDLKEIVSQMHSSLVATEKRLEILSDYHVVDAGALGFYLFIIGIYEAKTGDSISIDEFVILPSKKISADTPLLEKYPYEVISIISDCILTHEEVASMFNEMGDSLEVIEFMQKMKIHIHTANPTEVSDAMSALGSVESMQTVDMREGVGHH